MTKEEAEARLLAKLAGLNLREEVDKLFGYAFDHAEIAMIATSIMGGCLRVNDRFCDILGYTQDEVNEVEFMTLIHPEDALKCYSWGEEAVMENRRTFEIELRYRHKDGHYVHFAVHSAAMCDAEGDVLYFFTQMLDVTDRIQQEQYLEQYAARLEATNAQLEASDKLKTQFVAVASHELRNPITSISGFTQTLLAHWEILKEDQKKDFLRIINEQSSHLGRLVDDLLTMSKLDAGTVKAYPEKIVLAPFIKRVQETLDLNDVKLDMSEDIAVFADPHHLQQMLANYLTNAYKYGAGTEVRISARSEHEQVRLEVLDHGPGVDKQFVPQLFAKFSQGATTSQGQAKGTGLGLAIVSGLAISQGGEAYYRHRTTGGSAFGLLLGQA